MPYGHAKRKRVNVYNRTKFNLPATGTVDNGGQGTGHFTLSGTKYHRQINLVQ